MLLDSGATTSAIDVKTVNKYKLPLTPLPSPVRALNADGTDNLAGPMTHTCRVILRVGELTTEWSFRVIELHDADIYLGFDWLHYFNPPIDWKTLSLSTTDLEVFRRARQLPALPDGIPQEYAEFSEVFTQENFNQFPPERQWDHTIKFTADAPKSIAAKIYPLSPQKMQACREFIDENESTGRILAGASPITSSFFFIQKADGSPRPVMDYREINKWTVPDHYPLPLIEQLFLALTSAMVFTKLDIRWGFNNIRIRPEDRFRAAFITPFGTYIPQVMFFGLCNSPSTFQRVMNMMFDSILRTGCVIIYVDDILIFTPTMESHVPLVKEVLRILQRNQLSLKPSKCDFHKDTVEYLGRLISKGMVTIKPSHTVTIREWPLPTTKVALQRIIGLANYFRKFIPNYSKIIAPLTELTGTASFVWNEERTKAIRLLQEVLASQPVLKLPNASDPFRIYSDASLVASGALLEQYQKEQWLPIAFCSSMFSGTERRYPTHDREMLGIMNALREWRPLLLSNPHTTAVYTDHIGLRFFKLPQNLSYRHARWSVELSDYRIEIAYVKGTHNTIADALSRSPVIDPEDLKQDKVLTLLPKELWLPDETSSAPTVRRLISELDERTELLRQAHDHILAGHPGIAQTLKNLEPHHWPGKDSDVKEYVSRCPDCQRFKIRRARPRGVLNPLPAATYPFERISVDHISPLPLSNGFDAILVIVDFFTKFKIFIPCKTTDKSIDFVQHYITVVFPNFGMPTSIVSDRGSTFVSRFTKDLWKQLSVQPRPSTAYHPQTNGQTERANQELEQYLRFYCNYAQDNWSMLLPFAQYVMNSRFHQSIQNTPYNLMFGFTPVWKPLDAVDSTNPASQELSASLQQARSDAVTAMEKAAAVMKSYYDDKRDDLPAYKVGTKVWLDGRNITPFRPMKKLAEKRYGPFEITDLIGPSSYRLRLPSTWIGVHPVFNEVLLSPALQPLKTQPVLQPPPIVQHDEETAYEVEAILDTKKRRRKQYYLVKWLGYGHEENTWEPLSSLSNAKDALREFRETVRN